MITHVKQQILLLKQNEQFHSSLVSCPHHIESGGEEEKLEKFGGYEFGSQINLLKALCPNQIDQ